MKLEVTFEKENPLFKRKEVRFQVEHTQPGSTPSRMEIRNSLANILKVDQNFVFIKKLETKTGTHMAVGLANIYDSLEQAKLTEPEHIVKRNIPPEKPKEEEKG